MDADKQGGYHLLSPVDKPEIPVIDYHCPEFTGLLPERPVLNSAQFFFFETYGYTISICLRKIKN